MLSPDRDEGARELDLRKECEAFLCKHVLNMRVRRDRDASTFVPRGSKVSKLTADPETSEANEESSQAMGKFKESSVDPVVMQMIEKTEINVPDGLIPSTLPEGLRDDPTSVQDSDIAQLYDLPTSSRLIRENRLTPAEVFILYFRSFRNVFSYDVVIIPQLQRRFMGFFAAVFMDLVDMCHPDRGSTNLVRLYYGYCVSNCICIIIIIAGKSL